MAEEIKVSATSVRAIVKKDLGIFLFKIKKDTNSLIFKKRIERSIVFLICLKSGMDTGEIIFLDQKLFMIETQFSTKMTEFFERVQMTSPTLLEIVYHCQKRLLVLCGLPFQKFEDF